MIKRHADDVTIDYIIQLRKLEQENERLREERNRLREKLLEIAGDMYDPSMYGITPPTTKGD